MLHMSEHKTASSAAALLPAKARSSLRAPAVIKHAIKNWAVVIEVVLDQTSLVLRQVLVVKVHLHYATAYQSARSDE